MKYFHINLTAVFGFIILSLAVYSVIFHNKNEFPIERNMTVAYTEEVQNNINVLQRVIQAFNNREMEVLEQSVTPRFIRHDLSGAFLVKYTGSAEVTNFLQALFVAFPDIQLQVHDMIPSEDRIAMRYEFSGTHKGELFGNAATGVNVRFNGINIYRFEEEKIAEVWQLWDWASVLHQIGILDWSHRKSEEKK